MKSKVRFGLILIVIGLAMLGVFLIGTPNAAAQGPKPGNARAPMANAGTAFTYQGQLKNGGVAVNGTCAFNFGLWDASTLGNQVGMTQSVPSLAVTNGLFTAPIDFGANAFNGDARWLAIAVNCGSGLTALNQHQALTPAPMALALPGMYTQQNGTSPNVIGGYSGNVISSTVVGGTVGGGGTSGSENKVWANYGTVSGGFMNSARSPYDTVGGGNRNQAGGLGYTTISGGNNNTANGTEAFIGGGNMNNANGDESVISGGSGNTTANLYSTVSGGSGNQAAYQGATVGGGEYNHANNLDATVSGGTGNTASGGYAAISGGSQNTASGSNAMVPGGMSNIAQGDFSFAAGQQAQALNQGSFVWSDSQKGIFASTGNDQFLIRAAGGVGINTNNPTANLEVAGGDVKISQVGSGVVFPDTSRQTVAAFQPNFASRHVNTWITTTEQSIVTITIAHTGPTAIVEYGTDYQLQATSGACTNFILQLYVDNVLQLNEWGSANICDPGTFIIGSNSTLNEFTQLSFASPGYHSFKITAYSSVTTTAAYLGKSYLMVWGQ